MKIVDGYKNEPHITAGQVAEFKSGILGSADYVLESGRQLEYEIISNNKIHIYDGSVLIQGRHGCIEAGQHDELTIENGAQGEKRHDIIAVRYRKDEVTQIETFDTVVIKGVSAAADPQLQSGNLRNGDLLHEMPLYRVVLDGINIEKVEKLWSYPPLVELIDETTIAKAAEAGIDLTNISSGGGGGTP